MERGVIESNIGIYKITNLINNKVYIGKSINLKQRLRTHISNLKHNKHSSFHLQRSVNKYGIENFEHSIIEYCDVKSLSLLEDLYIDSFNATNRKNGYNILKSEELSKRQSKNAKIRNLKFGNLNKARLKFVEKYSIKVFQFDLSGKYINEYNSISEASRILNIDSSSIVKCCKNKLRYFKSFGFSYTKNFTLSTHKQRTIINVLNKIDNSNITYPSVTDFCKKNKIKDTSVIHAAIKFRGGNYKHFNIEKHGNN